MRRTEEEIDTVVARLFGLNDEEVKEVEAALRVVYGEGAEAEEKELDEKAAED